LRSQVPFVVSSSSSMSFARAFVSSALRCVCAVSVAVCAAAGVRRRDAARRPGGAPGDEPQYSIPTIDAWGG